MDATPAMHLTTQLLSADCEGDIEFAAGLLRAGNLVGIPTETVYGLAANALDDVAVRKIFAAKERPRWDPLIVHICDEAMLRLVARDVSPTARLLMDAFWPGPLTLLLPRVATLPDAVTAGRDLVGVRMTRHPVALGVIRAAGVPLAAPSANLFGHISPTTAAHVLADLRGRINAVLDAGPCAIGVESTVLDPEVMVLYRQGGVSGGQIERIAGKPVHVYVPPSASSTPESLPSPGVGVRHYAPRARLVLVSSEAELAVALSRSEAEQTGVMLPAGWAVPWAGPTFAWGRWDDPASLAESLYRGLRALDDAGVQVILCPLPTGDGSLLEAIRDRLWKAARVA
ncbi:MAG: L-threonylcarbamoyladenylate synthase [Janthinobacterium lividum]